MWPDFPIWANWAFLECAKVENFSQKTLILWNFLSWFFHFYLLIHKGQCVCVCLCVCLFNIEIQTAVRIRMKFGTEGVLEGGKVLGVGGVVWPSTPPPPGYGVHKGGKGCLWSLNRAFWQKLYKTKVAGHPWFSGGGSPFRAPNPEGPGPPVLLEPWSLTMKGSW